MQAVVEALPPGLVKDLTGTFVAQPPTDDGVGGASWRANRELVGAIRAAPDVTAVAAAGHERPRLITALVDSGVDEVEVGRAGSMIVDAMTVRLIELAIDRIGEPPVPWAWLSLGSWARREQAIGTDQDHALAFDLHGEPLEELDTYFLELARSVTSGLEDADIPRCRANVVAENRALRRPLQHWIAAFQAWKRDPDPQALRQTAILIDFRRVAGDLEVEAPFEAAIHGRAGETFLRMQAKRALEVRPPTRRFRRFVVEAHGDHEGALDLKHGGLMPVVDLARIYAQGTGVAAIGTLDRLRDAAARGGLDEETATGLSEAFRFMWRVRLHHHVDRERCGETYDDFVDPRNLGNLSRVQLRDAFRVVERAQRALRARTLLRVPGGSIGGGRASVPSLA